MLVVVCFLPGWELADGRLCMQVVVFGGGSFGTAIACALARQKGQLNVTLLLRDPYVCKDINERHINSRYLKVTFDLAISDAVESVLP